MSTSQGRRQPARNVKAPEGEAATQTGQEGTETIAAETVKKGARITGADRAKLAGDLTKTPERIEPPHAQSPPSEG